jgi:hypothetical protein
VQQRNPTVRPVLELLAVLSIMLLAVNRWHEEPSTRLRMPNGGIRGAGRMASEDLIPMTAPEVRRLLRLLAWTASPTTTHTLT